MKIFGSVWPSPLPCFKLITFIVAGFDFAVVVARETSHNEHNHRR
jgi:hypothetical protein